MYYDFESGSGKLKVNKECKKAKCKRMKEALKDILKVSQFGRRNGPIVTSEHYEAAWIDCIEIAKIALSKEVA